MPDQPPDAVALLVQAIAARDANHLDEALKEAQRALRLLEAGDEPEALLQARVVLGSIHQASGDHQQAASAFEQALETTDALLVDDQTDAIRRTARTALGITYRLQGRYADAERALCAALAEHQAQPHPDPEAVAAILGQIAVSFKYSGRFDEADELYHRQLAIVEQLPGDQRRALATIYHNLGGLEHARGDHAKAEPLARRSVELREDAVGAHHPESAADRAALAAILDGLERHAEAEALLRDALATFTALYGEQHYEVAVNLSNLA